MTKTKGLTLAEKTIKSFRHGDHATVYGLRRDPKLSIKDRIKVPGEDVFPFVSGANYKGQYVENKKEGFGTLETADGQKYEGEWLNDRRHGNGTLWIKRNKKYVKQYVGYWYEGRKCGFGTFHYDNGEVYKGEWSDNMRHGAGTLEYENGNVYIGDWAKDSQQGLGTMNYKNGNIYEGMWMEGKKEGPGKYFFSATSKIYVGEWVDDQPRCGEYRDPQLGESQRLGKVDIRKEFFQLPVSGLENPRAVLDLATTEVRLEHARERGIVTHLLNHESLKAAEREFNDLDFLKTGVVPIEMLERVFIILGVHISMDIVQDMAMQLDLGVSELTFPEVVDISSYYMSKSSQSAMSFQQSLDS
jgi:hypothetical protein